MIVISGASKGIGEYLFNRYVEHSESVYGTYLNSEPLKNLDKYIKLDVSNYEMVNNKIKEIEGELSNITLINCAGITYNAFTHKSEPTQWNEVIQTNLIGTYNLIRCILPLMRNERFGRIINFSSVIASKSTPGVSAYASSKAALWGLTNSIAVENAKLGITVNNINMGYSELGMISKVPKEYLEEIITQIPMGKLCEPVDIFSTVEYLRSNSYITGSSIDLNGGLY